MERHLLLLVLVLALVATTTTTAEPEASRCMRATTSYTGKAASTTTSAAATSTCAEAGTGKSSTARSATGTSTTTRAAVKTPAGGVDYANKEDLATAVALFCRRRSHAPCCESLVAYVDFAGICSIGSQPQLILARLNASRLLALYAACGGQHQNPTKLCQDGVSPRAVLVAGSKLSATCNSMLLARDLTYSCNVDSAMPSPQCCSYVLMTIDGDSQCLCSVIDDGRFALSRLDISFMWDAYKSCGGKRQAIPNDVTRCHHAPSPPPPPPAAPAPPAHGKKLSPWAILGIVLASIVVAAAMATAALKLYTLFKAPVGIATPPHPEMSLDSQPVEPYRPQGASSVPLPQDQPAEALEEDRLQESETKQSPPAELQLVSPAVKAPPTGPPPPLPKPTPPPRPPSLILPPLPPPHILVS